MRQNRFFGKHKRLPIKRRLPFKIIDLVAIGIAVAFGVYLFQSFMHWGRIEQRWQDLCWQQEYIQSQLQDVPKATQLVSTQNLFHEIKKLENIERSPWQEKRLEFLTSALNQMAFEEQSLGLWIQKKQLHPVEMDEEDLKRWLATVEGVEIWPYERAPKSSPYYIQECTLVKKTLDSQEKVFEVTMNILYRK